MFSHRCCLGYMLELGDEATRLHKEILEYALELNLDLVVATGEFAEAAKVLRLGEPEVLRAEDWKQAYPIFRDWINGDEVLLLKASRGIALEAVLPLLESDFGAGSSSPTVGHA